jgi:hypothetical protein
MPQHLQLIKVKLMKIIIAAALAAATTACGSTTASTSHGPATPQPPVVMIDARDLNLGSGVVSASSVCEDPPPANANQRAMKKRVVWRGVTNGQQPDEVALAFAAAGTKTMWAIQISSGGQQYENPWKDTIVTADGPTNGWYRFSGTVRKKDAHYDDPTFKVKGSIACANYGAPF